MLSQLLSRTVTIRTLLFGAVCALPCLGFGFFAGQRSVGPLVAAPGLSAPASPAMAVATHPSALTADRQRGAEDGVFGRPYGEPQAKTPAATAEALPNSSGVQTYRVPSAGGKDTIVVIIREDGSASSLPQLK